MKTFVIHRFKDRTVAKKEIRYLSQIYSLKIQSIFLNSYRNEKWELRAEKAIYESEVVIVFNTKSCLESVNAKWEIEKAQSSGKEILYIDIGVDNNATITKLISIYNQSEEFEDCFPTGNLDSFRLYKIMIDTSENLIIRRQKANAFFITIIGSLITIAGLLLRMKFANDELLWILSPFSVTSLLLCNSWRNLLDNYGKLNKAKYDVILKLEQRLEAQIFFAEWISLGKGFRPDKYKSFTSTEKNIPLYFALLIGLTTLVLIIWKIYMRICML
jgi:hypothetical protein